MINKVKAHIQYKLADGSRVPGVTTIVGQLGWNKQVLINWANRIGLEGISANKYRDSKAEIGTLGHAIITDGLIGKKTDTSDYSQNQIDQAENSVLSFYEWQKDHKIEVEFVEKSLITEVYGFGGTLDIYGLVNGKKELIDIKTGSGIYKEYLVQVAGYWRLLLENNYPIENVRILNIPRAENETFQEQLVGNIELYWNIFYYALQIYKLAKKIKKGGKS